MNQQMSALPEEEPREEYKKVSFRLPESKRRQLKILMVTRGKTEQQFFEELVDDLLEKESI